MNVNKEGNQYNNKLFYLKFKMLILVNWLEVVMNLMVPK